MRLSPPLPPPPPFPQVNNEEAIRFYKKFGFEVTETLSGYYRRLNPPDAVILARRARGCPLAMDLIWPGLIGCGLWAQLNPLDPA